MATHSDGPPVERDEPDSDNDVLDRQFEEAVREQMEKNGYTRETAMRAVSASWFTDGPPTLEDPPAPAPYGSDETPDANLVLSLDELPPGEWDKAMFELSLQHWLSIETDFEALAAVRRRIGTRIQDLLKLGKAVAAEEEIRVSPPRATRSDKGKKRGKRT